MEYATAILAGIGGWLLVGLGALFLCVLNVALQLARTKGVLSS